MRIIPVVLLGFTALTAAQSQDWEASIGFALVSPQGAFRSNVNANGYGGVGTIGYAPEVNPFMIGASVGYTVYGSESRKEPFSTTIPDVTVDVTTTNALVLAHLLLKIQPNRGVLRPYLQGAAGVNYLFTTTDIKSERSVGEEVASSTNESDVAFSYGGGAGVLVRVHAAGEDDPGGLREVLVDLGTRYMFGGQAEYLKEGSIRREGGRVQYDTQRSETDLLLFTIGVAFRF